MADWTDIRLLSSVRSHVHGQCVLVDESLQHKRTEAKFSVDRNKQFKQGGMATHRLVSNLVGKCGDRLHQLTLHWTGTNTLHQNIKILSG